MSLIAASIFVGGADSVGEALARAGDACAAGAKLIEWRIDCLAEEARGPFAARRLVRESPAPCIVTCRAAAEGGAFEGDESGRLALIEAIIESDDRPRYLDIELNALIREPRWRELLNVLAAREAGGERITGVILSYHDFEHRPADLIQTVEAMTLDTSAAVVKVAWRARSLRDNLEAFDLLAQRRKPMIALCMGPFGMMSRVLAPKFGGLLTFATETHGSETAPGQPTIDELRSLYHFGTIGEDTKVYGVIGWPVEHSMSPAIHNAGFAAIEHDGVYLPLPIPPEYEHFKATVGSLVDHAGLNFRGASVTLPHKENLLRFVRERGGRVDELAEKIGAANTLVVGSAGGLECFNTDCPAAVQALCRGMEIDEGALATKTIAMLGAGGAARAIVAGVSRAGAKVVIFNRTPERAEALARAFHGRDTKAGGAAHVVAGGPEALSCACFDVIVNCTPVGMAGGPEPRALPLPLNGEADALLDHTVTVFETVYAPAETPLVVAARARGARVIPGIDMFLRQAALQFERWTGFEAPMSVFERIVHQRASG